MTNVNIMRMSQLYAPTLKEDPADAEIASHRRSEEHTSELQSQR